MIRTCDGTDPNLIGSEGDPCDCGLIFDDVMMEVVYPHRQIMSREEKDALMGYLWDKVQSAEGVPYVWGTAAEVLRPVDRPPCGRPRSDRAIE